MYLDGIITDLLILHLDIYRSQFFIAHFVPKGFYQKSLLAL